MPASTRNINRGTPATRVRPARVVSRERESEPEEEEEDQEEAPEDDDAPIAFDPAHYKLDSSTAVKKLGLASFPRLSGPSNAMIVSGYQGFFDGDYITIGALGTPWYKRGYAQAMVFLRDSCTKEKEKEIEDETDPVLGLEKLEKSSKAIGNSHYCSLQKQWQGTTQASCGTAKDFKAAMLNINRQLIAMHPKYGKPTWEMNSWFINNLTDAYEHKVSSLSSNPKVIAVEGGMNFDELCLEIIEEEQRLTEKNRTTTTTVAAAVTKTSSRSTTDNATLALRIKELDKETRQLRASLRCKRCGKTGHTDTVGRGGCFYNPKNAEYRKEWEEKRGRNMSRLGKRVTEEENRDRSDSKKRRIESKDYNQVEAVGMAVDKRSYGPEEWDE